MSDELSKQWHISLHFLAVPELKTKSIHWRDSCVPILDINARLLSKPFPANFDHFIQGINALENGYAEGDGSFGIVGPDGQWKICGTLYERDAHIQYAELVGQCPKQSFCEIVQQLNIPPAQCLIQNMRGGFFQSIEQFFAMLT